MEWGCAWLVVVKGKKGKFVLKPPPPIAITQKYGLMALTCMMSHKKCSANKITCLITVSATKTLQSFNKKVLFFNSIRVIFFLCIYFFTFSMQAWQSLRVSIPTHGKLSSKPGMPALTFSYDTV